MRIPYQWPVTGESVVSDCVIGTKSKPDTIGSPVAGHQLPPTVAAGQRLFFREFVLSCHKYYSAAAMARPSSVVVASNLFGDILSDLGPAVCGTIGIAPSANINPERTFPSLFEPVHGSAPDIAGKGIANPIGQIWSGALMLDFLGHRDAARAIVAAIENVLADAAAPRTPDLGGRATTTELGRAIAAAL